MIFCKGKEINRILIDVSQQKDTPIDDNLVEHISSIGWENIILYGEYIIDPHRIKV